jgi:predicted RNase H-like HicB family nuclease
MKRRSALRRPLHGSPRILGGHFSAPFLRQSASNHPCCQRLSWAPQKRFVSRFGVVSFPKVMTVAYAVVVEREEDGRYSVYVPDLPGCASMGDSYEEAIGNIREAVACHLEGLRMDGLPVPPPRAHFTMVDVEAA